MVSFLYGGGRWAGRAVVETRHQQGTTLRVRPEGWTHGIWIGTEEVIG
jgi:hypothetical protein